MHENVPSVKSGPLPSSNINVVACRVENSTVHDPARRRSEEWTPPIAERSTAADEAVTDAAAERIVAMAAMVAEARAATAARAMRMVDVVASVMRQTSQPMQQN